MTEFPADSELIEFFGCPPDLTDTDADVSWAYNTLRFIVKKASDRVECTIDNPSLELRWTRDGEELIFLNFHQVNRLRIESDPGGSVMVGEHENGVVRISLKPKVHISYVQSQ
ncbi:MAG: hypothetical protein ABGZ35_12900 [Planctomycetaceae bacterium]|jgi:hypothetical protein